MRSECGAGNGFIAVLQREAGAGSPGWLLCSALPEELGRRGTKLPLFPWSRSGCRKGKALLQMSLERAELQRSRAAAGRRVAVGSSPGCPAVPSRSRRQGGSHQPNGVNSRLLRKTAPVENLGAPSCLGSFRKRMPLNAQRSRRRAGYKGCKEPPGKKIKIFGDGCSCGPWVRAESFWEFPASRGRRLHALWKSSCGSARVKTSILI